MDCEHITIVARADNYRLVSYCDHGCIHINWDLMNLHLRPLEFEPLVCLLQQAAMDSEATQLCQDECGIIRQKNGCCQLWIGNVALFFDPTDFLLFVDLMVTAQQRFEQQPPQASVVTLFRQYQPVLTETNCLSFHN